MQMILYLTSIRIGGTDYNAVNQTALELAVGKTATLVSDADFTYVDNSSPSEGQMVLLKSDLSDTLGAGEALNLARRLIVHVALGSLMDRVLSRCVADSRISMLLGSTGVLTAF